MSELESDEVGAAKRFWLSLSNEKCLDEAVKLPAHLDDKKMRRRSADHFLFDSNPKANNPTKPLTRSRSALCYTMAEIEQSYEYEDILTILDRKKDGTNAVGKYSCNFPPANDDLESVTLTYVPAATKERDNFLEGKISDNKSSIKETVTKKPGPIKAASGRLLSIRRNSGKLLNNMENALFNLTDQVRDVFDSNGSNNGEIRFPTKRRSSNFSQSEEASYEAIEKDPITNEEEYLELQIVQIKFELAQIAAEKDMLDMEILNNRKIKEKIQEQHANMGDKLSSRIENLDIELEQTKTSYKVIQEEIKQYEALSKKAREDASLYHKVYEIVTAEMR